MKVRLKFSKTGSLKFVGHLDLMRTFQKIFRQAGIPIAYSEGFNPHQIFSIAAPLSVGVTSHGEYLDMKLIQNVDPDKIIGQINHCCPIGLKIEAAVVIDEHEPPAMSSVSAAKYTLTQDICILTQEDINQFAAQETIIIKKKTKKGKLAELDIKPGLYHIAIHEHTMIMTLATGSTLNIKPEVVLNAFCDYKPIAYNRFNFSVHREELYHGDKGLIPLSTPVLPVF